MDPLQILIFGLIPLNIGIIPTLEAKKNQFSLFIVRLNSSFNDCKVLFLS